MNTETNKQIVITRDQLTDGIKRAFREKNKAEFERLLKIRAELDFACLDFIVIAE